jgi:endonuclease/exonuclease/phosphatase (EEP) superfamily protein YafD
MDALLTTLAWSGGFLVALLASLTALSAWKTALWWVRIWDYPRLHIALGLLTACALLAAAAPLKGPTILLLTIGLAAFAWQAWRIFPYTPFARTQSRRCRSGDGPTLKLLIANVLMTNRRADALLRLVGEADPDIVLAAETDDWWDTRLAPLLTSHPHALRRPQPDTYGLHFFSRLPLRKAELRFLVEPNVPSVFAEVELRSGHGVALWGLHPHPPLPGEDTEERDAELILVAREAAARRGPRIVLGDLNDVAWSDTTRLFQKLSRLLDPRVGRGLYATYPAGWPFLRWPLDHLFHSSEFRLVRIATLRRFGSDHLPILVELAYAPDPTQEAELPRADSSDHAEARERLRDAGRSDRGSVGNLDI